jgi:hypothetical protein
MAIRNSFIFADPFRSGGTAVPGVAPATVGDMKLSRERALGVRTNAATRAINSPVALTRSFPSADDRERLGAPDHPAR